MVALLPWQRTKIIGAMLIMVVSCFVWWKTVMYLLYGLDHITYSLKELYTLALVFYSPIFLWLTIPLYTVRVIISRISKALLP